MCFMCKFVKPKMKLSERWFKCESCGFECDRHLNAALNLASVAVRCTETLNAGQSREVHATMHVPGDESGTISLNRRLVSAPMGDV